MHYVLITLSTNVKRTQLTDVPCLCMTEQMFEYQGHTAHVLYSPIPCLSSLGASVYPHQQATSALSTEDDAGDFCCCCALTTATVDRSYSAADTSMLKYTSSCTSAFSNRTAPEAPDVLVHTIAPSFSLVRLSLFMLTALVSNRSSSMMLATSVTAYLMYLAGLLVN